MNKSKITNKEFLKLTIPLILSTITQPLLGAVDTAVVGHLDDPRFIGGVSVGAVIFSTIYWIFGFLRVTTTSLSAKAFGANSREESGVAFFRPLLIAVLIGFIFIIFQNPIFNGFMRVLAPGEEIIKYTYEYYRVLIYGAPFVLINYTILGWLMGRRLLKESLSTQIGGNLLNITLDFFFVFYLGYEVMGVAVATLISQIVTTLAGVYFISKRNDFDKKLLTREKLYNKKAIISMVSSNMNFMIRTICLLIQANIFTATSASFGPIVLAGNSILLQITYFMSYTFDGLANSASIYSGRALGSQDRKMLDDTYKITSKFIGIFALIMFILNSIFLEDLIGVFTNITAVRQSAVDHRIWLYIFPIVAGFGLSIYGIFTGTMSITSVRNSTVMALILYLAVWKISIPILGNNGVWLSMLVFYLGRSIFFLPMKKRIYENFMT